MQPEQVLDMTREALKVTVLLAAPLLLCGLVVGVVTNVFQAVTQITETTLAVVPKILAVFLGLVVFAPWMLDTLMDFTTQLFSNIPHVVR